MNRNPHRISPDEILFYLILLFGPVAHGLVETWSITTVHIATILLLTSTCITGLNKGNCKLYRTPIDIPVLLFLTTACLSLFTSVYPHAGRIVMYRMITCLALFYFTVNNLRSKEKFYRLAAVLSIFGGVYAFTALILTHGDVAGFKIFSGGHYNISLFFVNHSNFAGYLELTVWLSVGLATVSGGAKRLLFFVSGALTAVAVAFSLSRGGIIGLSAGLLFYLTVSVWISEERKNLWLPIFFLSLVLATLLLLGLDPVLERMRTLENPMLTGIARLSIWQGTLNMIFDRPLSGWGLGVYSSAFPPYQHEMFAGRFVNHAHNDYLELAAETGLPGLAAALLSMSVLFISCLRRLMSPENKQFQAIGVGALAGCFSLLVHAGTEFNFHIPSNAILFSVTAGIAVLAATLATGETDAFHIVAIKSGRIKKRIVIALICLTALLSSAAVSFPFLGTIYTKRSWTLQMNGEDGGVAALKKAMLFDPGNAQLMKNMGDILLQKTSGDNEKEKDLLEALDWYEQAVKACPVKGYYVSGKASLLERLGRATEAEQAYKTALRLAPAQSFIHYQLADLYLRQDRFEEAFRHFHSFLKVKGERSLSMVMDNIILKLGFEYDVLEKVVPETAPFRRAFAVYLAAQKKNDLAVHELELAFALEPSEDNALAHIRGFSGNKNFEAALKRTEEYLAQFPESLRLQEQKADVLKRLGRNQEAVFVYRKLLAEKDIEKYYLHISLCYAKDRQYAEAIAVLRQGIEKNPHSGRLFYQLGIYSRTMQQVEQTLEAFTQAISLDYNNVQYRYQLGEEYRRNGLYQAAADEWRKCLEIKSDFVRCGNAVVRLEKELGLTQEQ